MESEIEQIIKTKEDLNNNKNDDDEFQTNNNDEATVEEVKSDDINNELTSSSYSNIETNNIEILKLNNSNNNDQDLNEDEYDILNKNDVEAKLNEIKDKISVEELIENEKIQPNNTNNNDDDGGVMNILGNGSLIKKNLKRGKTDKRPKNGQICTISYQAKYNDDTVDEGKSIQFILGDGDIVPALDIAVSLMDLDEECELEVDSRHAYGEKGLSPKIPSNAKLTYFVKLEQFDYSPELNKLDTIERLSLAETKKQRGNYHYNRQDYDLAVASYKRGLKYFYDYNLNGNETSEDVDKYNEIKVILNMNVALSNYKLQSYKEALEALDEVLKYQSKHLKALFIKGKILMHIGELAESIKYFTNALEIDDKNVDIKKELSRAQAKYKLEYAKEKEMYQKMISGVAANSSSSSTSSPTTSDKNKKISKKSNNKNDNSYFKFSYLTATGIIVAMASIGIAAYARYKNYI